jgi:hypothetical protein
LRYFKFLSSFLHAVAIFLPGPVRFVEAWMKLKIRPLYC